jgi:hypothetical protein
MAETSSEPFMAETALIDETVEIRCARSHAYFERDGSFFAPGEL